MTASPLRTPADVNHLVEGYALNVDRVVRVLEVARHAALGQMSLPQIEDGLTDDDGEVVESLLRSAVALLMATAAAMRDAREGGA